METMVDRQMVSFCIMDKKRKPDGEGGFYVEWEDGAQFGGTLATANQNLRTVAEALGAKSTYTLTTAKNVALEFPDVVKRLSDGAIFRVKTSSDERKTPLIAGISYAQVDVESWKLT